MPDEVIDQTEQTEQVTDQQTETTEQVETTEAVETQPEESPIDRGIREANEREGVAEPKEATTDDKPDDKPAEAKGGDEDEERDEEIENEIVERKLTEKSADRFRELAGKAKQFDDLAPKAEAAIARAQEWEDVVSSTGATPEEFGKFLGVLAFMKSEDPVKMRQALAALDDVRGDVARKLGVESTGYDPLDEHPQIKQAVENGDIDRKHALELVAARKASSLQSQRSEAQQAEVQAQQAQVTAAQQVTALGNQLAASDPHYQAKLPILMPLLQSIRATTPPSQWVDKVPEVYATIPNPAPVPPRAPITNIPARGASVSSAAVAPKITSANAFDLGLQEANRRGLGGL